MSMSMSNSNILYITSFNDKIYKQNGQELIRTFVKHMPTDHMLVCKENMELKVNKPNLIIYELSENQYLKDWLEKNKDVIPISLGGTQPKTMVSNNWNLRASAWFRKIAAIKYAYDTYGDKYDYLVWIDADCVIKNGLSNKFIKILFNNTGMIYCNSPKRMSVDKGYETGFFGFSKKGYPLIQHIIHIYEGDFKKYRRWDDGYIIRKMNEDINKEHIKTMNITSNINHSDVIGDKNSIMFKYIQHKKGSHTNTVFKFLYPKQK